MAISYGANTLTRMSSTLTSSARAALAWRPSVNSRFAVSLRESVVAIILRKKLPLPKQKLKKKQQRRQQLKKLLPKKLLLRLLWKLILSTRSAREIS